MEAVEGDGDPEGLRVSGRLWTWWGLFVFHMVSPFSEERSPLVGQSCAESPPLSFYCSHAVSAHSPEWTHTYTVLLKLFLSLLFFNFNLTFSCLLISSTDLIKTQRTVNTVAFRDGQYHLFSVQSDIKYYKANNADIKWKISATFEDKKGNYSHFTLYLTAILYHLMGLNC